MILRRYLILLLFSINIYATNTTSREDQFLSGEKAKGYYVMPAPYSLPGYGDGLFFAGAVTNIADSYTDVTGVVLTGDITGYLGIVSEVHLIEKTLVADIFLSSLSQVNSNSYGQRGMASDKDDYTTIVLKDVDSYGVRLTKTTPSRELEYSANIIYGKGKIDKQLDKEGNVLNELDSSFAPNTNLTLKMRLDKSNSYINPVKGFVWSVDVSKNIAAKSTGLDTIVANTDLTWYVPIKKIHTVALNLQLAKSFVQREGETNRSTIEGNLKVNCTTISGDKKDACNNLVDDTISKNKYGNVSSLGGRNRLRGYPQNRFSGSKSIFVGAEYRHNFNNDTEYFDIFLAKGVRTSIQVAVFAEAGAVGDDENKLLNEMKSIVGVGLRVVTSSGMVFRADYGYSLGNEGGGLTVIIGYPWESF